MAGLCLTANTCAIVATTNPLGATAQDRCNATKPFDGHVERVGTESASVTVSVPSRFHNGLPVAVADQGDEPRPT